MSSRLSSHGRLAGERPAGLLCHYGFLHSDTICGMRTCGIGTMAWERPSTGPGKTARKTVEAVCREVGCLRVK